MGHTKIVPADLDSPRRELFVCGLRAVAPLSVRWQINFSCVYFGRAIQPMNDLFQTSFNLYFTIDNGRRRPSRRDGYAMVLATCFSEDLRK